MLLNLYYLTSNANVVKTKVLFIRYIKNRAIVEAANEQTNTKNKVRVKIKILVVRVFTQFIYIK